MTVHYHEPPENMSEETREIHRGIASVVEELEAVDWYHQRMDLTNDPELAAIAEHNRDEEVEHAAMSLEWLRRRMPVFDEMLRTYLFTSAPITEVEEQAEAGEDGGGETEGASGNPDLGIGGGA